MEYEEIDKVNFAKFWNIDLSDTCSRKWFESFYQINKKKSKSLNQDTHMVYVTLKNNTNTG